MSLLGPDINVPPWSDDAQAYYSMVEAGHGDSIRIMKFPEGGEASDSNPGTLCIQLVASFRRVRVLAADGTEHGVIHPRGPASGYAFHRSGEQIWTLSNRSLVLRRHALNFATDGLWEVRTPFYWWLNVVCSENGITRVLGKVGYSKRFWQLWIQPGYDHVDVLAALAFLHRRWWRR